MTIINNWKDIQAEKKRMHTLALRKTIKEFSYGFIVGTLVSYFLFYCINYSYPMPLVTFQ